MATVICLVNNILKNVVFCVQQKLLQVEAEYMMTESSFFGWTISLS